MRYLIDFYIIMLIIMKVKRLFILFLIIITAGLGIGPSLNGYDQIPHIHGQATGSLVITNSEAILEIKIPAISVLGFEHSPSSAEEHQRLANAISLLTNDDLVVFFQNQGWFKKKSSVTVSLIENSTDLYVNSEIIHNHDNHDHELHHEVIKETHAEIILKKHYKFQNPTMINALQMNLFKRLPDLHELNLALIINNTHLTYLLTRPKHEIYIIP